MATNWPRGARSSAASSLRLASFAVNSSSTCFLAHAPSSPCQSLLVEPKNGGNGSRKIANLLPLISRCAFARHPSSQLSYSIFVDISGPCVVIGVKKNETEIGHFRCCTHPLVLLPYLSGARLPAASQLQNFQMAKFPCFDAIQAHYTIVQSQLILPPCNITSLSLALLSSSPPPPFCQHAVV